MYILVKIHAVGRSMCFHMFCLNSMSARYIYLHLNKTKTSECKELPPIMYSSKRMYAKAKVEINDARRFQISQFVKSRL
jgi:hypothetical protein